MKHTVTIESWFHRGEVERTTMHRVSTAQSLVSALRAHPSSEGWNIRISGTREALKALGYHDDGTHAVSSLSGLSSLSD